MADGRVIGIDVGGTKLLAGVLDLTGNVEGLVERETPTGSQEELLDAVTALALELRGPGIDAVGVGIPARIDVRSGVALGSVNVPLANIRFGAVLEQALDLPVAVVNDAGAAALAELRQGAGRGARDLVLLTLGTGVGGGLVLDGVLYGGWFEAGHMVIVEDGEPCQGACTGRGHLESYCSGSAADRLARELLGPSASAYDLIEQRHPALGQIGRHLGAAVASLTNLFAPEVVVIGGGFGVAAGELLFEPIRAVMQRESLTPGGEQVRLAVAELGREAGVIGAGLVAFEALG